MQKNLTLSKTEKGQSLVELAFGIVMLFILLAGIVDFGRGFFTYMALRDAAQEGALYGSVHPTEVDTIKARARDASKSTVTLSNADISVGYTGDPCAGNGILVSIAYDFPISMPFIGAIIGAQTFTLNASVTDTIILPACP